MSVFHSASTPVPTTQTESIPEPKKNNVGAEESPIEVPLEVREEESGKDIVLEALNIDDDIHNLSSDDQDNVSEVKKYIFDIIKARKLSSTVATFKKTLSDLKGEMGMSDETDPSEVLDRVAGVVKAWKNMSFISDQAEKRRLFMQLAKCENSKEMNRIIFQAMENRKVWQ